MDVYIPTATDNVASEICRVKFTLLTECDNAVRHIYINSWFRGG